MSDIKNTRKVRGWNGIKMPNTAAITSSCLAESIADTLRRSMGHLRSGAKLLARQIGVNERTASNLLEGRNAPNAATLVRLCAEFDDVFEEVCRLSGRLPPQDKQARAEQFLDELAQRLQDHKRGIANHDGVLPPT